MQDMMKKILIIDDKEAIAKILKMYIGKENDITWFENPKLAIEWLDQGHKPDLIITDLNMPIMKVKTF